MNILIDIGGSGIKMADYSDGNIGDVIKYDHVKSLDDFVELIKSFSKGNRVEGVAISTAGFVDSNLGILNRCACASYLEGELVNRIKRDFVFSTVRVINDGEAHARSLLFPERNVKFGAIHLSLGTSVGFGVIDENKQIVRACNGGNWDIGNVLLRTSKAPYEVWEKLGSKALKDMVENSEDNPYVHYGWRLGGLLNNLAVIFRPRTIGLSGGILLSHEAEIIGGVKEEFRNPVYLEEVKIVSIPGDVAVMEGLTTLL